MTAAFFYREPMPLDRAVHQQLRLQPIREVGFAAKSAAVPLVFTEFAESCLEYPIVFVKSGEVWTALAVTGFSEGENLFVDDKLQWLGRYVPASIRRYPFVLAQRNDGQLGVCIDRACEQVVDSAEATGERLFEDSGEPTALMQNYMKMLFDYQAQVDQTSAFIARLAEAKMLTEARLEVSLPDGRRAGLQGAWMVSEAQLRTLPDETSAAWFRSGELALVYSHLISLRNLGALLQRRPVPAATAPAAAAPAAAI